MKIHLVLTGRAYQQGEQLPEQLELPDESRLSDALAAITATLPEGESLPESWLLAVAGTHVGTVGQHPDPHLTEGQELLLIAPVAGG
jgi:hypothetical protein